MNKEKIIIVHLNKENKISSQTLEAKLEEIKELVRSSNAEVLTTVVQNSDTINSKYYIGSGKVLEISELAENMEADTIVFNNELTGSQIRNLEDRIQKKIIDRTGLILDIFATRAKTKEAKLQVMLAQLEYRLPRLIGFRNYLSREGAGIGTRGPGEQKLETDRRAIQRDINSIKKKLEEASKQRKVKNSRRVNSKVPVVSLIGYSNAGKSTILNKIIEVYSDSEKNVYSDDLLFATLDTSARSICIDNNKEIIVSDTVGFISDLPTKLVESFKSTLEEIEQSDLLLIVVDSSNKSYKIQLDATKDILKDMDIKDKKIIYVFNKIDKNKEFRFFENVENDIYISALKDEDIKSLVNLIENQVFANYHSYKVMLSYSEYDKYFEYIDIEKKDQEEYLQEGIISYLYLNENEINKFRKFLINE